MAETIATRAQLLGMLKEVYGKRIAEQPNRTAFIMNFFDKSETVPTGGKYWTEPLLDEGGQAVGSYNEDEETGDAQAENYKEIVIKPRQHYALVRISGLSIESSRSNLQAFVRAKDSEIKNKTKWLIAQLNVQFYGAGKGVLGSVFTTSAGDGGTVTMVAGTNMNWFRKGMRVDGYTLNLVTKRNTAGKRKGMEIATVNKVTRVITMKAGASYEDVPAGLVVTDVLRFEDAGETTTAGADTQGKQLLGLAAQVDDVNEGDQTHQGVDRNVYTIFRGNRDHNSGVARPLSLDLMQKSIDVINIESGEDPDFMIAGLGQRRNYANLLWFDARYQPQRFAGGFKVLQYADLDFLVDKDCQLGRIYFGTKEYLQKYVVKPIGVLNGAGADMERIPKSDLYEMLIGGYFNLGCTRPNAWLKLVDLAEPA